MLKNLNGCSGWENFLYRPGSPTASRSGNLSGVAGRAGTIPRPGRANSHAGPAHFTRAKNFLSPGSKFSDWTPLILVICQSSVSLHYF